MKTKIRLGKSVSHLLYRTLDDTINNKLYTSLSYSVKYSVKDSIINSVITPLHNSTRWEINL